MADNGEKLNQFMARFQKPKSEPKAVVAYSAYRRKLKERREGVEHGANQ